MRDYLAKDLPVTNKVDERQHPRFESHELVARFQIENPELDHKSRVYSCPVINVSAGGIRILIPEKLPLKVDDTLNIIVMRSQSHEPIIKGKGLVTDTKLHHDTKNLSAGIHFSKVSQGE
jgi:hypothetical protein